MEVDTPVRVVALLVGIAVLSSIATTLLDSMVGFPSNSSMAIWGILAPGLTSYIYGRKYKKSMPKSLRNRSVILYFCVLLIVSIITFSLEEGDLRGAIEWGGVLVFAAAAMSLITYLIFWLPGLNYDDP
jgi:uncharacterized membrane protein